MKRVISIFITVFLISMANAQTELVQKWEQACQENKSEYCHNIGYYYEDSVEDEVQAQVYYDKACELGFPSSCFNLGILLQKQNLKEDSIKSFQRGCLLKDSLSCYNYGIELFQLGRIEESIPYFEMSCDKEFVKSCYNLACVYSLNNNLTLSLKYLEKSFLLDYKDINYINNDIDLENLRSDARFNGLIEKYFSQN